MSNPFDVQTSGNTTTSGVSSATPQILTLKSSTPTQKPTSQNPFDLILGGIESAAKGVVGGVKNVIQNVIPTSGPVKVIAKTVAGGGNEDLLTAIKQIYGAPFTDSLSSNEIDDIVQRRQGYLKAGLSPQQATVQAANDVKRAKALNRNVNLALSFSGEAEDVSGASPEISPTEIPRSEAPQPKPEASPESSLPDSVTPSSQFVKNAPIDFNVEPTDKATAKAVREEFTGVKNEQIVRGNQLADQIRQVVPDQTERQGMFWYKAANGDLDTIKAAIEDPKFADYKPQLEAATKLSPEAKGALDKIGQYYDQAGKVSQDIGSISNVRENYQNRIYQPEPPQDFVSTELKQNLKQTTSHAKARVFDTEFQAVEAGKKFATTDIADALSIHNEEMARVNTSIKLGDALQERGLASWTDKPAPGWSQVGNVRKGGDFLTAPEGIANGLKAIADPDFTNKIDSLRGIQKYQGLIKTVDLSYSFFHHFTETMQALYQGNYGGLAKLPVMSRVLNSPEFEELEQDFVRNTGITAKVADNEDILRNLTQKNPDLFSKITNLPGVKQLLDVAGKSSDFLFGKVQRLLKVEDYGSKVSDWIASHPEATDDEVTAAKRGFAKQINAAYGGLNWEAMGMTKSNLSLLRKVLLAPDWTISNGQLFTEAFKSGTEGAAARAHYVRALVVGMVLTEGVNKILTGHFTNQNPPAHQLEVEVAPNVYVSFLKGGLGDLIKYASNLQQSGPLKGTAQFLQAKLAPIPRTAIGALSNVQYSGAPISTVKEGPLKNTIDYGNYIAQNAGPIPFGVGNISEYLATKDKTVAGAAAVGTGVGRFTAPSATKKKQSTNPFNH